MSQIIITKKQLEFITNKVLNKNVMNENKIIKNKKVVKLTENDLKNIVKRVIKEQDENYKINMTIQCFLNKKGIKDDAGQSLKLDGSIGNLPNSKSAQAVAKYQSMIKVTPDGVWGEDTMDAMPEKDKVIFKQCMSDYGDLFDKIAHYFGWD